MNNPEPIALVVALVLSALILLPQFLAGEPREGAGECESCAGYHAPTDPHDPPRPATSTEA